MIQAERIRGRFPALQRTQDGVPVLYFDNPAGTQVPQETIDGFSRYLSSCNANVGGLFATSRETGQIIRDAHAAMADFLNAASPTEIVFGQNMTSLTFTVSHAIAQMLQPGDEIVLTRLEHDANIAPWLALEDRGIQIRWIDINPEDGTLDLVGAEEVISQRTRLVAVGYASNALGTINDVRRVVELAHAHGAWVFVDAVHYAPHGPIDVQALGCDLLACSSYKFFGPHLGILYGRAPVLETLPAFRVRPAGDELPGKWETGTQSHESLSALLGTIAYLRSLSEETDADQRTQLHDAGTQIQRYERTLTDRLLAGMKEIPGMRILGITDPASFDGRVPTVSFLIDGHPPAEVSGALGRQGIFSWAGDHYALEPLGRLRLSATNRIGLVHYNTPAEIDRFLEALAEIAG